MKTILETERLTLREFTTSDTEFIINLLNSPGWIRFIGKRNVETEEQAKSYLENGPIRSYEINGYGLSLVELKSENTPIGMCGIIKRDNLEFPDIGFALLPQFTGKGYAFEIANATLQFAKNKLNLKTISAITVAENESSIKLLEKIGLKFIRTFQIAEDKEELLLFSN